MRLSQSVLPIVGLATWANAQKKIAYNPQNASIFQLSSDPEFAFALIQMLAEAPYEASSAGEVLRIAQQVVPNEINSWYSAYYYMAEQMHALAESIDATIDPVGAREAYFHASTYYRQSVFYLVGNASDPRLYDVWPKQAGDFAKAIALLRPAPGVALNLTAKHSSIGPFPIPAYFFKGSASSEKLPTVVVGTGYDGAQQDLYHLACGEILKRGINCLVYEGPGQPTARREGYAFIPDWWSVVTPIVDYLETRSDVDRSKLILLGDSFGGLLAPLAASKEHRFSGMVLNDGYPNFRQSILEQFPPALTALFNESKKAEYNEAVLGALANSTTPQSFKDFWWYSFWALKETEPYAAWKRLAIFKWGPETAKEIGDLPVLVFKGQNDLSTTNEPQLARNYLENDRANGKKLTTYHEFKTALGAGEHTSIGAESQIFIEVFAWLSEIWGGYTFNNPC